VRQGLQREGDGSTQRLPPTPQNAGHPRAQRRGDGDAHRRLARSTFDLFAIVKQIVDADAQSSSLAEPWPTPVPAPARLMIAVLGGLADVRRDLIRTRTAEAAAERRSAGSGWAENRNWPRRSRSRPASGGRKVLRWSNSRAATAWEKARFHGSQLEAAAAVPQNPRVNVHDNAPKPYETT
jgi:hypothetical protein